jgi:hypothetical protein
MMVVVPLTKPVVNANDAPLTRCANETNWIRYAAAGTLAASGVLLITGNRRAGLVAAASGAVLTMIDQQATVSTWWNMLPGFLEELHSTLGRAQVAVEDLSIQGQKLREVFRTESLGKRSAPQPR